MIKVESYKLPNGLRLLHHYDASTRMVALNLLYDVGSRDENPSMTGLAHLMEHLMFTGSLNAPSYDGPLQKAGGSSNAWTSCDVTNYYDVLPAHNVETAFWLESDRLLSLSLDDESVALQKSVVIEEFKQRCLNQPYGDILHLVHGSAYTVHPYRWPTIGLATDDIEKATSADVRRFFESHYSVDRLVLAVSGNVRFDVAVKLAEKWFGDILPRPTVKRSLPQEPVQSSPRLVKACKDVPHNMILKAYHMCGRNDAGYRACDMLSDVLSNGKSSRLYRNVLMNSGLFIDIDASVSGLYDPGLFYIKGRLSPDVEWEQASEAIDREIVSLLDGGVTEREVAKCANKYASTFLFDNIAYAQKAVKMCEYELCSSVAEMNQDIELYRSLTPDDILHAAQQVLRPENCTTLYYGPDA